MSYVCACLYRYLLLQETKLQEKDVEAMRQQDILPGYASVWSCSTKKKGYAGTAVFFTDQAEPWAGAGATPEEAESEPVRHAHFDACAVVYRIAYHVGFARSTPRGGRNVLS